MNKLDVDFTMKVKGTINLTEEEYKEYIEFKEENPNKFIVDLEGIKEDIINDIGFSKADIKFSNTKENIKEKC